MPIHLQWLSQEQRVIILVVESDWTWDDFYGALHTIHDMMDDSPHDQVNFILDMRNGRTFPQNILSHMKKISTERHLKSEHMIVVGANRFVKALFNVMERIMPSRMEYIHMVNGMDEALLLLDETKTVV